MFKKRSNQIDRGVEALVALTAVLAQMNETLLRLERKIDDIHEAYNALNTTK